MLKRESSLSFVYNNHISGRSEHLKVKTCSRHLLIFLKVPIFHGWVLIFFTLFL